MSKTFRAWDVDQEWLLPASVHDFVPAGHPARLTRDVVRETLDLGAIMAAVPSQVYGALPYLVTIIILAGVVGRSIAPAAVGQPYQKEGKTA